MKINEAWLRTWVNPPLTTTQLAAQLTLAGLEIDGIYPVAGEFNKVIVAQVLATQPHPKADRLTLCTVDAGLEHPLQIVCGARNVRPDLKVALAMIGAHLPGGLVIKESQLRDQLSQGMLCSSTELGLDDAGEGILELPNEAPIGTDLHDYLLLHDQVLDISLTPNRADCFSVLGIARDVAALNDLPLNNLPQPDNAITCDDQCRIHVQASDRCPYYGGRIITGLNPSAQTPLWLKERLRRAGIRPVNPVVDVTQYVMLELGQPLHAYDHQTLTGNIHVRLAKNKEHLTLLDGQELSLADDVLVIADDQHPLAIAGIMGGQDSAVNAETTTIFLESAFFTPHHISNTARRYQLFTDAAQRFERGVDPHLWQLGLEQATALILSIAGGQAGPVTMAKQPGMYDKAHSIRFNPEKVKALTGITLPNKAIQSMLERLNMVVDAKQSPWQVQVPSYRFDIGLDVDLVEEVLRLHGYDQLPSQRSNLPLCAGSMDPITMQEQKMGLFLSLRGYRESIGYSFIDPTLQDAIYPGETAMQLVNPISSELSQMRLGLWPGLIATTLHNSHRQQHTLKIFEAGVVFNTIHGKLVEQACFAGLLTGEIGQLTWCEQTRVYDFYDLKGDVEALLESLHYEQVTFTQDTHPALHPGQTARILINNQPVGWLGALHPELTENLDLKNDVFVFELNLHALKQPAIKKGQAISKYPQIRRDLSLLMDKTTPVATITDAIKKAVDPALLKNIAIFDVYEGGNIAADKKSLGIALTLQDGYRTLVDTEINAIMNKVVMTLETQFSISLRELS